MWKKILLVTMFIMCIGGCTASVTFNIKKNKEMEGEFEIHYKSGLYGEKLSQNPNPYPYKEAMENNSFNIAVLTSHIMVPVVAPIGYDDEMTAPTDICYYKNIGDKEPVYVIKKGTVIYGGINEDYTYRGVRTLPTTKRGWRLELHQELRISGFYEMAYGKAGC